MTSTPEQRKKYRIFKSRKHTWLPWILVKPESSLGAPRRAVSFATHDAAFTYALYCQDMENYSKT